MSSYAYPVRNAVLVHGFNHVLVGGYRRDTVAYPFNPDRCASYWNHDVHEFRQKLLKARDVR